MLFMNATIQMEMCPRLLERKGSSKKVEWMKWVIWLRVSVRSKKKKKNWKEKSCWMLGALPHSTTTFLWANRSGKTYSFVCERCRYLVSCDWTVSRRVELECLLRLHTWAFDVDSSCVFSESWTLPPPGKKCVCAEGAWAGTKPESQTVTPQTVYQFP